MRTFFRYSIALCVAVSTVYSQSSVRFAVIGDYGDSGADELAVANLVRSWNPDFVITTGDNNYPDGATLTIDQNIGQYYHEFIYPYVGIYGQGATVNRFFPSLGNHDWYTTAALPYLTYFTLPGNERYYDFVRGPVHFFALDSDPSEPDGNTSTSIQASWLHAVLTASTAPWKIVYFHHPPYSSGSIHGSSLFMRWPFATWGATAVLAGHEHNYERIFADSIVYFVNGLGGRSRYSFGTAIAGSQVQYNSTYGAMLVEADLDSIVFNFINQNSQLIDRYRIQTTPTDIREFQSPTPAEYRLFQNYPNPFNPSTVISFQLPVSGFVTLKVYNLLGQEAAILVNEQKAGGTYNVQFDASPYPGGVYFYRLSVSPLVTRDLVPSARHGQTGGFLQTRKLMLIK